MQETPIRSLCWEDTLQKGESYHLAFRTSPGGHMTSDRAVRSLEKQSVGGNKKNGKRYSMQMETKRKLE